MRAAGGPPAPAGVCAARAGGLRAQRVPAAQQGGARCVRAAGGGAGAVLGAADRAAAAVPEKGVGWVGGEPRHRMWSWSRLGAAGVAGGRSVWV